MFPFHLQVHPQFVLNEIEPVVVTNRYMLKILDIYTFLCILLFILFYVYLNS